MTGDTKPAASANAAGSRNGAHSWQATRTEYAPSTAARQEARFVTRRAGWAGQAFDLRFDPDDPHWRVRASAGLDPHSSAAYAVRAFPQTPCERGWFAVWAECEMQRIAEDAS